MGCRTSLQGQEKHRNRSNVKLLQISAVKSPVSHPPFSGLSKINLGSWKQVLEAGYDVSLRQGSGSGKLRDQGLPARTPAFTIHLEEKQRWQKV